MISEITGVLVDFFCKFFFCMGILKNFVPKGGDEYFDLIITNKEFEVNPLVLLGILKIPFHFSHKTFL